VSSYRVENWVIQARTGSMQETSKELQFAQELFSPSAHYQL
jgi:hypothetical protein